MRYSFKDIVIDSRTGLNPRRNFVLGNGTNNYLTIKDIYNGQINITDKTDKVDDAAIQIIKRRSRIKVGDILFVSIGRIGETAIVTSKDDSWDVNESVFVFTVNSEIITPEYFCLMFQSEDVRKHLTTNSSGSTFKSIKMNQLEKMTFDLPSLSVQKSITSQLAKVKAVCLLRERELERLDDLIKARFVEMFGDPCNNPMGHIKMTVKEAIEKEYIDKPLDGNHGEKHPKASEYVESGVPFVMANNLVNGVVDYEYCSKITRERADKLDKGFAHDGDVLITHKGTIGRTAIVHTELDYIMLTPQVTYYRPVKGIIASYLKCYFDTDYFQEEMKKLAAAGGSTRAYVGITNQTQLQLLIPRLELQKQFAEFVNQVDKLKAAIQKALHEAQLLFDSLMQKYFG